MAAARNRRGELAKVNIKLRVTIAVLATVVLLPLGFQLTADSAQAQEQSEVCKTASITKQASDIGDKQLIVSAHGYGSDASAWGLRERDYEGSMLQAIDGNIDNTYYYPFNYASYNQQWVTDSNIGPKLADTISCLAQLSRDGGGNGKVIVLAHSMGGLATRYAAESVGNDIGLVITIGTPHHGAVLGNALWGAVAVACSNGIASNFITHRLQDNSLCTGNQSSQGLAKWSSDMRELPDFPDSIPVKAIAGNLSLYFSFRRWNWTLKTGSDTIVGVESATHQYTTDFQTGDGKRIVDCTSQIHHIASAPCQHSGMLRGSEAQQEVVDSIEAFIEANKPKPEYENWLEVHGKLKVPTDDFDLGAGISEPFDMNITDFTNCTDTSNAGCPHVHFIDMNSAPDGYVESVMSWYACADGFDDETDIGGEGVLYTHDTDSEGLTSYCWMSDEHGLFVTANDASIGGPIDVDLWAQAFADAEWV